MRKKNLKKLRKKYIINDLKESDKKEGITLVCTFSRQILVPIFFKSFNQMNLPRKDIHLLVYDNTQDGLLSLALKTEIEKIQPKFKSVRLYKSWIKSRGSITGSGNEQFAKSKLYNIWSMWKRLFISQGGMIYTPTFFQLEDDTIAPPNAFKRLHGLLLKNPKAGFITGVETGRHAYPWIPVRLGVHKVRMKGMKVIERISYHPNTKGVREIDAAGVYCFAARTKAYKTAFEGYDPIDLRVPFFALDNVLTWNIKQHGWKLLCDFSVWCAHLQCSSGRIIAFGKDQATEQVDLWLPKYNNYIQCVEVKKKGARDRRFAVKKHAPYWEYTVAGPPFPKKEADA